MARKATKDTYAIEEVGGTEVRRKVFAGDTVPEQYNLESGSYEETEDKGETQVGKKGTDAQPAYGDSPDPVQQQQAEQTQSPEQQQEAQSPAQPEQKKSGRR